MLTQPQHPDTHTNYRALKQIRRGSRQAADTAAMEAMYDAIDNGVGKEEANEIFTNTYKQFLSHEIQND